MARLVLVAGATGATGSRVVERLLARGDRVRVLSRSAPRARDRLGDAAEVHVGDVRDPGSLIGLGTAVDAAICTIGSRTYFGANGGARVDAEGTANLTAALAGLPHLVYLSAFGLDRRSVFLSAFSLALNRYFRWKAQAEDAVRSSGIPYTIARPVELRDRPPRHGPLLNQAEPLSLLRTVSRDVVADVLVACLDHPGAIGRTFEVCEAPGTAPVADQLANLAPDGARPVPRRTPLL